MSRDPNYHNLNLQPLFELASANWSTLQSMSLLGKGGDLMQCSREDEGKPELAELQAVLSGLADQHPTPGVITCLSQASWYVCELLTYTDSSIGKLMLKFDPITKIDARDVNPLCELLISDYQLNTELDSATMELTDRYEELNLIYGTDETSEQCDLGHSVLANLVLQCAERMNVNTTILLLPDQNVFIIEQDEAANMSQMPVEHLAHDVFLPWVLRSADTIIINDEFDSELEQNCPDLEHKVLICPIYGYSNIVCGYIGVFNTLDRSDFSNSDRNLLQIMSRRASRVVRGNFDELTGLANKASFEYLLDEQLKQQVDGTEAAMLLVDLRGVHIINESVGDEAGDHLIRNTAQLISAQYSSQAVIARLEGDLFAIAFNSLSVNQAYSNARALLASINAMNFEWHGTSFQTNASMAIVPLDPELGRDEAITTGKIAIQLASEKGNNVIEIQRPDDTAISQRKERMRTLNTIHSALENDYFELYCQAIYPANNHQQPHHYEILLRLHTEEGDFVSPDDFIPAAEYYKVMPDIDRWVIRNTLQALSQSWHLLEHTSQSWAINLSGQTFTQPNLPEFIAGQLAEFGLPANKIGFEVTETVAVDDLDSARATIEKIRALGCEFYLDDFGTGLSSFTYLQQLPFDHVKIDGSFVKNVVDDEVAQAMVKAIADVAHVLGMKTVAEYVENEAIIATLLTLGVEFLQGYGLHKPTALSNVLAELDTLNQASA